VKLRTIKKRVEVVFEDGTRMEGSLFLSTASAHRWGNESIEELLNGGRKYLPMELSAGELVLLSKKAIVMAFAKEEGNEPVPANAKKIPAEVTLRSGERLRGEVYNDLPMTHLRLSDYLNQSETFFRIEVGATDCYVSNGFVRLIKPADPDEAGVSSEIL
jgi:hypothetical protein